ncbi:unnamed protein product [Porites lobata]|uniref:Uncharacterized protein n=1 Tax=Porites lobata TaxID=104759 RepID=A0ABN8MY58_9CNID|nr:unnamed protein product [Porites lobata]
MMDKVVPKEKLIDEAKSQLNELTVFSVEKWRNMQLTKMVTRKDAVEALENRREEDIKEFVDSIMDEEVQKAIGLQVEKLHKKK